MRHKVTIFTWHQRSPSTFDRSEISQLPHDIPARAAPARAVDTDPESLPHACEIDIACFRKVKLNTTPNSQ